MPFICYLGSADFNNVEQLLDEIDALNPQKKCKSSKGDHSTQSLGVTLTASITTTAFSMLAILFMLYNF